MLYAFVMLYNVADTESDASAARQQDAPAACADASGDGGTTKGSVRCCTDTKRQLRGHVDAEVQHAVAVLLLVLRRADFVRVAMRP